VICKTEAAAGTAGLNVPMFIALRRFTLLCTIILERVLLHRSHDRSTWGAVGIMIGGTPPPFSNLGVILLATLAGLGGGLAADDDV